MKIGGRGREARAGRIDVGAESRRSRPTRRAAQRPRSAPRAQRGEEPARAAGGNQRVRAPRRAATRRHRRARRDPLNVGSSAESAPGPGSGQRSPETMPGRGATPRPPASPDRRVAADGPPRSSPRGVTRSARRGSSAKVEARPHPRSECGWPVTTVTVGRWPVNVEARARGGKRQRPRPDRPGRRRPRRCAIEEARQHRRVEPAGRGALETGAGGCRPAARPAARPAGRGRATAFEERGRRAGQWPAAAAPDRSAVRSVASDGVGAAARGGSIPCRARSASPRRGVWGRRSGGRAAGGERGVERAVEARQSPGAPLAASRRRAERQARRRSSSAPRSTTARRTA